MNLVAYTAIFEGFDKLTPVPATDVPFICFADVLPEGSDGWNVRLVKRQFHSPRREARMYKLLSHQWFPGADITLWLDGAIELKIDPSEIVAHLGTNDLAVFRHIHRNCIYEEAKAILRLFKAPENLVREQVAHYRQEGMPENNGLVASHIVARRHTEVIERFNNAWWGELTRFTARDQMSFNYVCWKPGLEYSLFPDSLFGKAFVRHDHWRYVQDRLERQREARGY